MPPVLSSAQVQKYERQICSQTEQIFNSHDCNAEDIVLLRIVAPYAFPLDFAGVSVTFLNNSFCRFRRAILSFRSR